LGPQEIILHALFESGTTEVQHLERYIKDDVVRYGGRLSDLERKLGQVYQEHMETEADVLDDEELFADGGDALIRCVHVFIYLFVC